MSLPEGAFYVTGGTLQHDAPSYVERRADTDLYGALRGGEFCYVLTARQMGKSSLMVRTAARLEMAAGAAVAVLDLTALGQNLTVEQWYDGLLGAVGKRLDLEEELDTYWKTHRRHSPLQRFMGALRDIVLTQRSGAVVIFIDEIDAVRSLPFSTDEFFAAIRECYNRRTADPALKRLTFCLLGVAAPTDLIRDPRATPFNIGHRIELSDFTEAETASLERGLTEGEPAAEVQGPSWKGRAQGAERALLSRVLYWTGGHPYLTQRLCKAICESDTAGVLAMGRSASRTVDRLCSSIFLTPSARERDDNLIFVRERLVRGEDLGASDPAALLDLYRQVREGRHVLDNDNYPLCTQLKLAGAVRPAEGRLRVRNRIYERVFDPRWVQARMPGAERRRQLEAYRRGVFRTAAAASLIVVGLATLTGFALAQRNEASRNASLRDRALTAANAHLTLARSEGRRADLSANDALKQAENAERSAYSAHRNAQQARRSAFAARQAQESALSEKRRSQDRLVALTASRGELAADNGDLFAALGWYARAASLDRGEPAQQELHRLRAGTLIRHLPRLLHAWFDVQYASFNPEGDRILTTGTEGTVSVWGGASRQRLLSRLHPEIPSNRVRISTDGRLLHNTTGEALQRVRASYEVAFDPEGKWVATAGEEPTTGHSREARVWNLASGKAVTPALRHENNVRCVAFSRDGRRVATGCSDGHARVWDAGSGKPITSSLFPDEPSPVLHFENYWQLVSLEFDASGSRLLAVSPGSVTVWNPRTGGRIAPKMQHNHPVDVGRGEKILGACFSPEGARVMTFSGDHTAQVWNADTGRRAAPPLRHAAAVTDACFSPDGRVIATASADHTARVWNAITSAPLSPPLPHGGEVADVSFDGTGRRVLTREKSGRVSLWDLAAAESLAFFLRERRSVSCAAWSPDGKQILTAQDDGSARAWDGYTGAPNGPWMQAGKRVSDIQFSRNGRSVLAAAGDAIQIWDWRSGRLQHRLRQTQSTQIGTFSRDSRLVVTAAGNEAAVWSADSGRQLLRLRGEKGLSTVAISSDGRHAAAGSEEGALCLWDTHTGRRVRAMGHRMSITSTEFSPTGSRIVTASQDGAGAIWDANTGKRLAVLLHSKPVQHAAFSPDGQLVLTAAGLRSERYGEARLWNVASGRPVGPSMRHQGAVLHACFSPDGKLVGTSSSDRTARVWLTATGEAVSAPLPHIGEVWAAWFQPGSVREGYRLLTGSNDGTVQVWNLPRSSLSPEELERAAALLSATTLEPAGGRTLLTSAAWRKEWESVARRDVADLLPMPDQITAWKRRHDYERVRTGYPKAFGLP